MKVGFDIDGVLASFFCAYEQLTIKVDGRNLFPPLGPEQGPPVWDWPEHYGYSKDTMTEVWDRIRHDVHFWKSLPELHNMHLLRHAWESIRHKHDIYFITDRVGATAKIQTEEWLTDALFEKYRRTPTVLISGDKAGIARALKLDIYVDDKSESVEAVSAVPFIQVYLQDRFYNRFCRQGKRIVNIQPVLEQLRSGILVM
jgi:5'(3')-deoxyribonucleotidase